MGEDPFETEPLMSTTKRGAVQVSAEILRAARHGGNQSQLFRLANLNHARGKEYLRGLERAHLLAEDDGVFTLTDRGRAFLDHWDHVESYLRSADADRSGDNGAPAQSRTDGAAAGGSGPDDGRNGDGT